MKTQRIPLLTILCLLLLQACGQTKLPGKWEPGMKFSYSISHGMSGTAERYSIDSGMFRYRYSVYHDSTQNISHTLKLSPAQLNDFAAVLRHNKADLIEMEQLNYTVYDGAGFTIELLSNGRELFRFSNSHNTKLKEADAPKFNNIVTWLQKLLPPKR
jgi:hypothetical protein